MRLPETYTASGSCRILCAVLRREDVILMKTARHVGRWLYGPDQCEGGWGWQILLIRRQLKSPTTTSGFCWGREAWLALFRDNLSLPANHVRRKFLFAVHGDGGVGKTFLIRKMDKLSVECGWLTAVTDETAYDVLEVMASISRQLNGQGARLKRFEQQFARYRKRQHELEAGAPAGDDTASLVTQTVVRMGVGAARSLPGGGAVTEFIDARAAAESTDRLRVAVTKKLRSRDDVKLLLSPIEELTPALVEGLRHLDKPVALFFDTYEQTSSFLDRSMRDILAMFTGRCRWT